MTKIINCTPHALHIQLVDGEILTIEPSTIVPRIEMIREKLPEINGIPVSLSKKGRIQNLPMPETDTFLIVSAMVAEACPERRDLLTTGEPIRNADGVIIGCKGLARLF